MIPGSKVCKSVYGLMPGDYTWQSFKVAQKAFPDDVLLNINDYNLGSCYPKQVDDLVARGCKVDVMGAQMHLFNPKTCLEIAEGTSDAQSPASVWETMARIGAAGKPLHLSEITIPAPGNDEKGQAIQAVIARNLYRLWFSIKPMAGITWWNLVDDCGAPGEPSISGLFSRDMDPKPAYHALRALIQDEWMTRTTAKADKEGALSFRGFRGTYRLSWKTRSGSENTTLFNLE
jgi:GH35 family endo-1,4-beta-xylanase